MHNYCTGSTTSAATVPAPPPQARRHRRPRHRLPQSLILIVLLDKKQRHLLALPTGTIWLHTTPSALTAAVCTLLVTVAWTGFRSFHMMNLYNSVWMNAIIIIKTQNQDLYLLDAGLLKLNGQNHDPHQIFRRGAIIRCLAVQLPSTTQTVSLNLTHMRTENVKLYVHLAH